MNNLSQIITYLKEKLNFKTDAQIANLFGISQSDLNIRKRKNLIPFKKLIELSENYSFVLDEIFTGRKFEQGAGEKFRDNDTAKRIIKSLAFIDENSPEQFEQLCIEIFGLAELLKGKKLKELSETIKSDGLGVETRKKLIYAMIYFLTNTNSCGKTKLLKLLYFLDFTHFRETGESVTGLDYYAWKQGPVPKSLFYELSDPERMKPDMMEAVEKIENKQGSNFFELKPKIIFNDKLYTSRELKILNNLSETFKNMPADEIVEKTHLSRSPWAKTIEKLGEGELIDYMLIVDGKHGITKEEAMQKREEKKRFLKMLGIDY
jgi:uncharacterized phage-associated protein